MNRKLRRRLRVIAARATLCAAMMAALGFTGYRNAAPAADTQVAGLSP
ncbi:hypothetical protein LYSHEL_31310 [Lysobacter helvus]|uniref:Uncharacterized protein n=2 Tax=Lysobacteraceae TaxID=32033 RepID=A0ABN6FXF0_9GAMM|nr:MULTISPECIES: hypothetical protein [Lysobacter]BCT94104.1 hypothetical protein LYSCAS_31280 [Lysobacter caseinilyticus]BCT97260.1 hypothetical protein LYSHEL_31310 [Lysobacter helvus]